ncbi:right-handed parallel beta-helix repeat-containing protein, partial [candidate division KSB1 bacterium]|nr:right-handed parallel beta-helix repeat-containing protein [candidate division KSB1 bacterium]
MPQIVTRPLRIIFLSLIGLCLFPILTQAAVIYVDTDATSGADDGSSWTDAFTKVQDGIGAAVSADAIWVAAGTYYPDEGTGQTNNARTSTFQLKSGVGLYGGFGGTETLLSQRSVGGNLTILSGDQDQSGTKNTNDAYHVVTGVTGGTLDGFTITGGNADGSNPNNQGAGMYNSSANPAVSNCTFTGNAASDGGGMRASNSTLTVTNCVFTDNTASGWGGGMDINGGNPTITNCTFSNNTSGADMGHSIMVMSYGSPTIIKNCIVWGANYPVYIDAGALATITYSDIQLSSGTYSGTGNINSIPLFVNGLHLDDRSQCIGTATATGAPATDLEGTTRGTPPDMGAYENSRNTRLNSTIYVDADAVGNNNGSSWSDAFTSLRDAISVASTGDGVWVATGTYYTDEVYGQSNNSRASTFQLKNGMGLYGGFAGTETLLSQRSVGSNTTILSGDQDQSGTKNSNDAYHVVTGVTGGTLDGFTITGGNADGSSPNNQGAGMYNSSANPVVSNCTFTGNA